MFTAITRHLTKNENVNLRLCRASCRMLQFLPLPEIYIIPHSYFMFFFVFFFVVDFLENRVTHERVQGSACSPANYNAV